MDTKKFILLISALTAIVCALTVVYNFASMPSYGDTNVSAVALYTSQASTSSDSGSLATDSSPAVSAPSSSGKSSVTSSYSESITTTTTKSSGTSKASSSSKSSTTSSKAKTTAANPVNLNTATLAQLETVPYIGVTRAQAIITYRTAHGSFKSIADINNVKGFGTKMIAKVSPYLTLG